MQFRPFGTLSWKPSALGFGCMRLPVIDGNPAAIDETAAWEMIEYAVDQGVNYLDTAYPYHQQHSEPFIGRMLQSGLAERVKIATKLPCWKVETKQDFDRLLAEQLERLQSERVDFYLLHALNKDRWEKMRQLEVLDWLEGVQSEGRIDQIGFSFHDDYATFQEIVDAYQGWSFCQIQYNYMDLEYQAGRKGLHYAAAWNLAVVIMEPIRGGRLVDPPQKIQEIWDSAPVKRSPAAWALLWLWNQPEVSLVLSGMSTLDQVKENTATAAKSSVSTLTQQELAIIHRVREAYESLTTIPCTQCEYCLPCPHGVNIPRIFSIYNNMVMYEKPEVAKLEYNQYVSSSSRADLCQDCGECEEQCPQAIPIREWLGRIHEELYEDGS